MEESAKAKSYSDKYLIGEFWTSRQRQANRIHEVSYRACFKPQLPRFFIEQYTDVGNVVYDPFMGRGTTPIEAALLGRIPYGNDLSYLSRVLTEPRINPPSLESIIQRLSSLDWEHPGEIESEELLTFYHVDTLKKLEYLKRYLLSRELDKVDQWIRMVAVNRLTGHSPGFFSVYTMPPNQAVSLERQRIINKRRNQIPEYRDVPKLIMKKSKSLLSQQHPRARKYLFLTEPSQSTPQIKDCEVELSITSPPFLDVVDYHTDNWLRNWFLGMPQHPSLSIHRRLSDWMEFTKLTLQELTRITKWGGHIGYEVGEVRKGAINLDEVVIECAKDMDLQLEAIYINEQIFTKTSNCWGVSNNSKGTNSNRIVCFRKL